MNEEKIEIIFNLKCKAADLFDFIIRPQNMNLYSGFLLIPGIKKVDSSDSVRKVGTLDKISNTDGSSHESTTDILDKNKRYSLTLKNIVVPGFKNTLANPISGFREDWIMTDNNDGTTSIHRTLIIQHKAGLLNAFLIRFIIRPQIYFSLLKHHQNIMISLSSGRS